MNLMFQTSIGAMGGSRSAFLRPETAQGMFMLFPALYRHFRQKLPFRCDADREGIQERNQSETGDD